MEVPADSQAAVSSNQNLVFVEAGSTPIIVPELRPNDVLLGRGTSITKYQGNVNFRALIKSRKREYTAAQRRVEKDMIALSVINVIAKRNGRFLQRVRPRANEASVGEVPSAESPSSVWQIADRDVATEKVKQALRGKEQAPSAERQVQNEKIHFGQTAPFPAGNVEALQRQQLHLNTSPLASFNPLLLPHPTQYRVSQLLSSMYPPPFSSSLLGRQIPNDVPMPKRNPAMMALMMQQLERRRHEQAFLRHSISPTFESSNNGSVPGLRLPSTSLLLVGGNILGIDDRTIIPQVLQQHQLRAQMLQEDQGMGVQQTDSRRDSNLNQRSAEADDLKQNGDDASGAVKRR